MENSGAGEQIPKKSKRVVVVIAVIALIAVLIASVTGYVVLTNQSKEGDSATVTTPAPEIPSKTEVTQIMTSVDDKIDQATSDQASASAALKEASTPVKVDL